MTTISLNRSDLVPVITAATRAPSVHNTQPWLFHIGGGGVRVYADNTRRLSVGDPTGTALRVSCGAAILNLRLAFAQLGYPAEVHLLPDPRHPDLLAEVTPGRPRPPTPAESALY